jgi:hypothetical protein
LRRSTIGTLAPNADQEGRAGGDHERRGRLATEVARPSRAAEKAYTTGTALGAGDDEGGLRCTGRYRPGLRVSREGAGDGENAAGLDGVGARRLCRDGTGGSQGKGEEDDEDEAGDSQHEVRSLNSRRREATLQSRIKTVN